jgi:hypothetical protein
MAKQTKELSVIDFEKFSIAQLPELQGKKEEIASIIKANPIVEIVDNSTYELAKKSRTAVKTLRTGLEKEQKDVKKKIKELVLDVVDAEYDALVLSVRSSEELRQNPINVWETKKEQERQEKARLEQECVDGIKAKIKEFGDVWERTFSLMKYENIKECIDVFKESIDAVDSKQLEEFEILFTDKVSDLRTKLYSRITFLTTEEELRLERQRLAEIQAEQNRVNRIKTKIDSWEKNWLYVINTLEFKNISITQNEFETKPALDCQEFQSEYAAKRRDIQEILSAKVSQLKEQENQRIERENFLKEKAEFEEKMRLEEQKEKEAEELLAKSKISDFEQKVNNRIIELVSYGLKFDFQSTYTDGNFFVDLVDIKTYSEEKWNALIDKISKYEETIKVDGYSTSEEEKISFQEHLSTQTDIPVIDSRVFCDQSKTTFQDLAKDIYVEKIDNDEEWRKIYQEWDKHNHPQKNESMTWLIWLQTHYKAPTKK